MAAYDWNIAEANSSALESSAVASALLGWLKPGKEWRGTAAELLERLTPTICDEIKNMKSWPKSPRGLSNALARIAPNLETVGICLKKLPREGPIGRRVFALTRNNETPSEPSVSSADNCFQQDAVPSDPELMSLDFLHTDSSDDTDASFGLSDINEAKGTNKNAGCDVVMSSEGFVGSKGMEEEL
jgi:hypothetical protein